MQVVATIRTAFATKFGVPRQSGLAPSLEARIVLEPAFRNPDYIKGIEAFSHLWLIWRFSAVPDKDFGATVRPPRLGGNARVGVFATRSPFRPNRMGLSSVRLLRVEMTAEEGPVLVVTGADLMDQTPILDIKPYLPYTDSHPDATGGFTDEVPRRKLTVFIPETLKKRVAPEYLSGLVEVLSEDPRPAYQDDPARVYGFRFADREIHFTVAGDTLTVTDIAD